MNKSRFMQIALGIGSLLMIAGVILFWKATSMQDEKNMINVRLEEGEVEKIEFENLALIPGEACEYTVSLKKDKTEGYDLHMKFSELEEKTLKNFAYVRIEYAGETVYDKLLADAFADDELIVPIGFEDKNNAELKIVYYLPIDTGNEAKKAEAIFELLLSADNK